MLSKLVRIKSSMIGLYNLFRHKLSTPSSHLPTRQKEPLRSLVIRPLANCTVFMWEHPTVHLPASYTMYRGVTDRLEDAHPVPGPIFGATDAHRRIIQYSCVDRAPAELSSVHYWLACQNIHCRIVHGPYVVHRHTISDFV